MKEGCLPSPPSGEPLSPSIHTTTFLQVSVLIAGAAEADTATSHLIIFYSLTITLKWSCLCPTRVVGQHSVHTPFGVSGLQAAEDKGLRRSSV